MNGISRAPIVSIIMSMRNSAATVGSAVRSVQLQTLRDWELIVIDDGSADQGASIVRAFADGRIRLVGEATNAGLSSRLNQAVALSRGQFVARMDADDICFPERLSRQVERLQQEPTLDIVGCGAVVFANNGDLVGELPVGATHSEITARPFVGFSFPHPTWCGRAAWFRANPYDSGLMYAEDQDLLLRTFRKSTFGSLEDVLFGYRQNQLGLHKLLPGRRTFIGSLWRYAQQSGELALPLTGIATHLLKGGVDIATVGLGFNRWSQRRRLKPVSTLTRQRWQDVQAQLSSTELAS